LNDGTIHTRFHRDCNRVENGVQTTHNPEFAKIVPVSALGCEDQFRTGNYRYDDRLRARRFPLVDEQRGLVLAFGFIATPAGSPVPAHRRAHGQVPGDARGFCLATLQIDDGMIWQIEGPIRSVPLPSRGTRWAGARRAAGRGRRPAARAAACGPAGWSRPRAQALRAAPTTADFRRRRAKSHHRHSDITAANVGTLVAWGADLGTNRVLATPSSSTG
jgi:hypothetical protein